MLVSTSQPIESQLHSYTVTQQQSTIVGRPIIREQINEREQIFSVKVPEKIREVFVPVDVTDIRGYELEINQLTLLLQEREALLTGLQTHAGATENTLLQVDGENHALSALVHLRRQEVNALQQSHAVLEMEKSRPIEQTTLRENIITRPVYVESIVEQVVERPVVIENVREVPVEKQVLYHVERTVEKSVVIEELRDKPVTIDRPYIVENIVQRNVEVPRLIENVVERMVPKPVLIESHVQVPVESTVFVEVTKPVERSFVVETEVKVPVEKTTYFEQPVVYQVDKPVDRPVYIENLVERTVAVDKPVYYESIVEKTVERPVIQEVLTSRVVPKDVFVESLVSVPVEVPVFYERAVPVPLLIERSIAHPRVVDRHIVVDSVVEKPIFVETTLNHQPTAQRSAVTFAAQQVNYQLPAAQPIGQGVMVQIQGKTISPKNQMFDTLGTNSTIDPSNMTESQIRRAMAEPRLLKKSNDNVRQRNMQASMGSVDNGQPIVPTFTESMTFYK